MVDKSQARLNLVSGIHTLHHHRRWNFHYFCKARHNHQGRSIRERPVPHLFSQQTSFLKVSLKNQSRLKVEAIGILHYATPPPPSHEIVISWFLMLRSTPPPPFTFNFLPMPLTIEPTGFHHTRPLESVYCRKISLVSKNVDINKDSEIAMFSCATEKKCHSGWHLQHF